MRKISSVVFLIATFAVNAYAHDKNWEELEPFVTKSATCSLNGKILRDAKFAPGYRMGFLVDYTTPRDLEISYKYDNDYNEIVIFKYTADEDLDYEVGRPYCSAGEQVTIIGIRK